MQHSQSYTEHTIKFADGVEILYMDSGAPPNSSDYTTLVVLHGTAFNGDGFGPLHEHAPQHNFRLVVWNRRDYRGSTKYSDEELGDLKAGRKIFQDRLALQLAWFLEHLVKNEATPKPAPGGKAGGIILMGWSFGNATALSLLADPGVIPRPLYETIEPYLLGLVLYDPPSLALGYPGPDTAYNPFRDPEHPSVEAMYERFQGWVGGYFTHPDVTSGKESGLSSEKRTARATVDGWTAEQKARYVDHIAAPRSELPCCVEPAQSMLRQQGHNALFNEDLVATFFPRIKILHITGAQTINSCIWGYMGALRRYNAATAEGRKPRPTTFKLLTEGNHFLHYDCPEVLLGEIVSEFRGL